jgi:hypothetical protein
MVPRFVFVLKASQYRLRKQVGSKRKLTNDPSAYADGTDLSEKKSYVFSEGYNVDSVRSAIDCMRDRLCATAACECPTAR